MKIPMSGISPQQKKDPRKKREKGRGEEKREQGLKSKRCETSYKEAPYFKKKKRR
jgi:hypothetical protein